MFVMRNTNNLFGIDCLDQFQLWDMPINSFCQKILNLTVEADKLKEELKGTFPEVFFGRLDRCKMSAKFEWKPNIPPVFIKKRNVPFSSLNQIDEELNRLEQIGVLSKVEYIEWASLTVYVKKKSRDLCLCRFLHRIEQSIKRLPLSSLEFRRDLCKTLWLKIFSKNNLSDAYLQIHVDEEYSKLLCINIHWRLYKFGRLLFGIKVTPTISQHVIDTMLGGLEFTIAYLDDILTNRQSADPHKAHV